MSQLAIEISNLARALVLRYHSKQQLRIDVLLSESGSSRLRVIVIMPGKCNLMINC